MASSHLLSTIAVLLCAATGVLVQAQIPDVVIQLDAHSFEHDTQASTGQTTGHWFVLFNSNLHKHNHLASRLWDKLAKDEDKEVIFAEVDLDNSINLPLARQYEDIQPPSAVLFRDRMMYVYPGPVYAEGSEDKLREFCRGGYEQTKAQPVPGSATYMKTQEELEAAKASQWSTVALGIAMIGVGFLIRRYLAPRAAPAPAAGGAPASTDPLAIKPKSN